jgi:hypothetical protein
LGFNAGSYDVERFTEADLIEALLEAQPKAAGVPGAMRSEELADALGWSVERTRRQIRRMIAAGELGLTTKSLTRIDGVVTTVAAYYLTKQRPG